jgi:hypothetical protein
MSIKKCCNAKFAFESGRLRREYGRMRFKFDRSRQHSINRRVTAFHYGASMLCCGNTRRQLKRAALFGGGMNLNGIA